MFRHRRRSQKDFSSEIEAHLALEIERLRTAGLSEEEARVQARKAFGSVLRTEERFYESRRPRWLDILRKDLSYAIRQILRNRTFAAAAQLTLALGVGSTVAMFTLVHATLLRELQFRQGDRIMHISDVRTVGQSTAGLVGVPRFFDLKSRSKSFESLAFFFFHKATLATGSAAPIPVATTGVSGQYWDTIGVTPFLGRAFSVRDDQPGAAQVAIITYSLWQRVFGGNRGVVNQEVALDGRGTTIVGVLPPESEYPRKVDIWTPARFHPSEWPWRGDGTRFVNVLGRLKTGVSATEAQAELRSIGESLRREHPDSDGKWMFNSESMRDYIYGGLKAPLLVLLGASGVLLLIACINVANLLLSRGTARAREIALRRALGASYRRILTQFLTENALLSFVGSGVGLLAAYAAVHRFGQGLPGRLGSSRIEMSWSIVAFTFVIAVVTTCVFGCVPALQARRLDLNTTLKKGDVRVGGAGGRRFRSWFITIEVALSLVLLVGASLLAESLWRLIKTPLGFQPDRVLAFSVDLPRGQDPPSIKRFFDGVQNALTTLPGVTAVGQISALPTVDWHLRTNFDVDWKPRTPHGDAVNVEVRAMAGDYLKAMQIRLMRGRPLAESDEQAKQPRALVNQQFVRNYIPDGNPIGRHLINSMTQFEIVGVIGDVRGTAGSIAAPAGPEFYFLPDVHDGSRTFVVRSVLPPQEVSDFARRQVHRLDPSQAIRNVGPLTQRLEESISQPRFNAGLLSSFAVIAILLACVGIYGVVSYAVTQRSLEVGIRMALGATSGQILRQFVSGALVASLIGIGAGAAASFFLTRLIRSELYGVEPNHLSTFGLAALALLVPTLLASVIPAIKAARLNPVNQLRKD